MTISALDHRLLRQFLAVADTGTVRAAADTLNISQPPLTQAIKRLESALGLVLFERHPKGMTLTPAGAELASEARQILMHLKRAERRVRAAATPAAPIRVGFVSAALNGVLTKCLKRLLDQGYKRPVLKEMTTPQQLDALANGDIDIGLLHPPVADTDMATVSLGRDPFVAAIPHQWELAKRKSVRFADVANQPLVLFPKEQGPSLMGAIERLAFESEIELNVAAVAPRLHSQLAIVASGLGSGLVTKSTAETFTFAGVTFVPISGTRDRLFLDLICVGRPEIVELVAT